MTIDRNTITVAIVALAIGWYAASHHAEPPKPDRPVLTWIARLAKAGLWIMLCAEKPPQPGDHHVVHARTTADGSRLLNNAEGW